MVRLNLPNAALRPPLSLAVLVLFLFSILLYAGSLRNNFVWDDEAVFLNDPAIRDFGNIPSFFAAPLLLGSPDIGDETVRAGQLRYYRPMLSVFHAVEYRLFGANPFGYKAVNLILNGLVGVTAFLLVRAVTGKLDVAWLSALLYAANPTRGEVVYWAYSDSHLFTALLSLLALLAYHRRRTVAALACMATALLFQESAILLPAILIGYELLLAPTAGGRDWQRLSPFFVVAGAYLGLRHLATGALPVSGLDFIAAIRATAFLAVKHLQIFFVTDAPVTMYLYSPELFAAGGVVEMGTYLLAGALFLLAVVLWNRQKPLFFWYAWFFIWIAVVFNVGSFARYLMAEKTLYLASLGPCVVLASLALMAGKFRGAGVALLVALTFYHATATVARAKHWADTETYLEKVLEFEPAFDIGHYQLGNIHLRSGQFDQAAEEFEKVLALRPELRNHLTVRLADARDQQGKALAERGDYTGAMAAFRASLKQQPQRSTSYNGIGIVHFLRGEPEQAATAWQTALRLDPKNTEARSNLEMLRQRRKDDRRD